MREHARQRLMQFGKLCGSLGAAAQALGASLSGIEDSDVAAANLRVRDLLIEASEAADVLAQLCTADEQLGSGHEKKDATEVALLFRILRPLGDAVLEIADVRLHALAGAKFETWTDVSAHLREAARAAHYRAAPKAAGATPRGRKE